MTARTGILLVAALSLVSCIRDEGGAEAPATEVGALPAAPAVEAMPLDALPQAAAAIPAETSIAVEEPASPRMALRDEAPFDPRYEGIETRLLDGDLVSFHVRMRGARTDEDIVDYAECAAAQYTLIRGYGFARHVRTKVAETGGLWQADAVYTISESLPKGFKTIDAEVVTAACVESGIPTV